MASGSTSDNQRRAIHTILKQYWGFESFRPLQEDIILSVLSGRDTLALMPTGGGKSLCYQVPALTREGMCLVISPLIALMKDQVENLRKRNITAYAIYSGMTRQEVIHTLKTVINSNCRFLYVSPERLETALFKEYLPGMHVNLVAVDEAHCISQWGYDFRPPYLRIAALREELPGIPVLALTASATKEVQDDICNKLTYLPSNPNKNSLHDWKVFRQSFERANLSYSVFKVDSRINKIIEILSKVPGSGIVYCKSRRRTKEISELLQLQNISADFYHAGLGQQERSRKQEEWIANTTRVIVCTNAFGMGIDKPDVRTVIHADVPDCLENYYQEAGRAGRDGKRSYAVLLYDEHELRELEQLPSLRFPSLDDIKQVYQSIANYLRVPAGDGEGQYFDFDISDFLKKFKLNSYTVLYALKALEQEGWLSFNEQVFLPARVNFTTGKNQLYEFEKNYPLLEPVIKTLLRAYEGIFDYPSPISEMMIARLLREDVEKVKEQLRQLNQYGIIEYQQQKDTPQLFFLKSRSRVEDLSINKPGYAARKEKLASRIREMIQFIGTTNQCRSKMIGVYFGDESMNDCGICDNCLRKKNISLTQEEFDDIHNSIVATLQNRSLRAKELLSALGSIKKEKAWKVIEFLQAENKIEMDESGKINLSSARP
ncbi:MAG: RecQ family ATP-dependent DNA helicase [Bacteroidetes bacterium]|nr:MAG: RecQ family ATP-dependent DNA helicase [Bacteroidota bacterium]